MFYAMLSVTVLIVLGAFLLFISLFGEMPPFLTQRLIAIMLPGTIILVALFAGLTFIVRSLEVLAERMRDISREIRNLKQT